MFALKKFSTLREDQRLRYAWRWIIQAKKDLQVLGTCADFWSQLELLKTWLQNQKNFPWQDLFKLLVDKRETFAESAFLWELQALGLKLERLIGLEAAEWDLSETVSKASITQAFEESGSSPKEAFSGKYVYLDDIRSPFNVGAIFRSAEVFGFSGIILSPACPSMDHPRLKRAAMGCDIRVPWWRKDFFDLLQDSEASAAADGSLGFSQAECFALELGGRAVEHFTFPKKGLVVLGSEELGVNPKILEFCDSAKGRVSISVCGSKASLNVGVSFGILAHAWSL